MAIATLVGSLAEFALQADLGSKHREETVIGNGINSRMKEIGGLIVPQAVWDDAVVNLDNQFDAAWAHKNIGQFFSATNGFNFAYVLDAQDHAIYAMENGSDVGVSSYSRLEAEAKGLVAEVRNAEIIRTRRLSSVGGGENLRSPIQLTAPKNILGDFYFVTATLVQPDFGTAHVRGARAPVIVTGRKLDPTFMAEFADRYLLSDLHIHAGDARDEPDEAHASIVDEDGSYVATLDWMPQTPGSVLFAQIVPWTLAVLTSLLAVALLLYLRARHTTERLVTSEKLASHIAYHDALTELPNRAYLESQLADAIWLAAAKSRILAVHCLDLDHFKELNKIFGPGVGDEVLRLVADRLTSLCGSDDFCVRFGGDGFAIVQFCAEVAEAEAMAERILTTFSEPLNLSVGSRQMTCSVGVAIVDELCIDALEYVRRADLALHAAKESGRSRVCMYNAAMDAELQSRHQLVEDLRSDLASSNLKMVYQPQVDGSGCIIGVEALVRWTHSTGGPISPAVFVPLAESSGLIAELGNFTIRKTLEDSRRWPDTKVAINISATQIRMPGFASQMAQITSDAGVDPSKIEIELTEGVLLADDEYTRTTLLELRSAGFTIALDDFGTGYSSLSYLRQFPINKIKIDRSFVSTLGLEEGAEAVVAAIVGVAQALNLSVIAEGVETKEQWAHLITAGCSQIQGYIASRPVEADRILELIERSEAICAIPNLQHPADARPVT
jgi:diguanylate cyclase (GGDEF)-like protein